MRNREFLEFSSVSTFVTQNYPGLLMGYEWVIEWVTNGLQLGYEWVISATQMTKKRK